MEPKKPLRPHDDLDAAIFFMQKRVVSLRGVLELYAVGDDEAGIDLSIRNSLEQRLEIMLAMSLPGFDRKPLIHHRAHWQFIDKPSVDSWDRNRPSIPAG